MSVLFLCPGSDLSAEYDPLKTVAHPHSPGRKVKLDLRALVQKGRILGRRLEILLQLPLRWLRTAGPSSVQGMLRHGHLIAELCDAKQHCHHCYRKR